MAAQRDLKVHVLIDQLGFGGAETLLGDFARGAPAAGLDVSVSYLHRKPEEPAAQRLRDVGIEPVPLEVEGLVNPGGLRRIRAHVAGIRPDVVHTHLAYSDLAGAVVGRSLGIPVVSTIHVMEWDPAPRSRAKDWLIALSRRAGTRKVLTVSDAGRHAFLEHRWDRPGRVMTVRNGVLGAARPGAGRAVRAELGLAEDDVVVTMLTVLRPKKGHDVAVEAVRRLRERHPNLRLVIAGDGPSREEITALAATLGDGAVMAGHRSDVMELLDATDVLLHPSRVDALPTALIEAAAAGVPVVATAVGGIPEIVQDGVTGALVPAPPEAGAVVGVLEPLVADAELRRSFGAEARARFEQEFSVESWAIRCRAVYDDILAPV